MINAHRTFIGCWGSAFHNLLFHLDPTRASTHLLCEDLINPNYYMIDAVLGLDANYVQCLDFTPGAQQGWPHFDLSLDVEQAMAYLAGCGII